MIAESLLAQITEGRKGVNQGYSTGLPKLDDVMDGVMRETYTLIVSTSGSGKTSLVLNSYLYHPLMETLDNDDFKVVYFSLEMKAELLFGKLLSLYIWETYHKQLSIKELLSRKKNYTLSEENYQIAIECLTWLKRIEEKVIVYDKAVNADVVYSFLMKYLEKEGTFEETEHSKKYIPYNPHQTTLVIIDHMSLCRPSKGRTLKEEIDLISAYLVTLRNMCGISPVVIMQTNRAQASMDRRKEGMSSLNLTDIKDSGGPSQDSEVVIGINNPFRDKLNTYRGYDLKALGSRFRSIEVLKSRYGEANFEIGCAFYGNIGLFKELPKPEEITDYDYYLDPDGNQVIINTDNNYEEDDSYLNIKFTI